jgi:hypothetical protein
MPPAPAFTPRLRCDQCGRLIEVTNDELTRFTRGTLPRCCTRVLTLEVGGRLVRPAERTKVERHSG